VLEAVIHLLGDRGFGGMSVEAVALRAGVSKATIYRHWASKEALCA
jgi:AcrR family transcriptional regulator